MNSNSLSFEKTQELKAQAAELAVGLVHSGTVVGLGTGSTAIFAVRLIAQKTREGLLEGIVGIPTSRAVEAEARQLQIPLSDLETHPVVDLTIDGADEVAPNLDVIKGGGGALLREKIVAQASQRVVIIVDESKPSAQLGTKWAVPVEVIPFGWETQRLYLESLGAQVVQRVNSDGSIFHTDHGNYILDCDFGPISNPLALSSSMNMRAGIVEHGLFLNIVTDVVVAGQNGVDHHRRQEQK